MCLGIPGKVIRIDGETVIVDYEAKKVPANNSLVNAKADDYVLVNGGFVIQVIPEKEALRSIETWKEAL